jgi:ER-bound oxygenase mpaB/B'/Rubber oxygenase, catalytic domain
MGTMAAPHTREWSLAELNAAREGGDPLADAVISELFGAGDIAAINSLMRNMIVNEYPTPDTLPGVVRDYLAQSEALPDWADLELIQAGEQVFWRYGPQMVLNLHCYGLPFCYVGQNGVHVLALTTRLVSNPTRRVVETGQMVIDVMQPGGLTTTQGRGRRTIQKVRLMHAAIRKLAPTAPSWNSQWGLPVNQEDLAGTLMAFSWIALDGLDKLGYPLTAQERSAFLHSWLVVGHLLGIQDSMLPADVDAARELTQAIAAHQFGPSADGQALTAALVQMLADILPGTVLKHAPPLLIRYFLGRQWAEWLGIEEGKLMDLAAGPLKLIGFEAGQILQDCSAIRTLAEKVSQFLINALILVERGGNRPSFAIPADLRAQWGVNWTS